MLQLLHQLVKKARRSVGEEVVGVEDGIRELSSLLNLKQCVLEHVLDGLVRRIEEIGPLDELYPSLDATSLISGLSDSR